MKSLALASFAVLSLATSLVQASSTDPVFYGDQGTLVLPNLKLANDPHTYSVVLHRQGNTWNFTVDTTAIITLSLDSLGYTPPALSEILGTWSPTDMPGSSVTLNANGTYSMVQGADASDPDCPNGGPESGTYQYEVTTGVLSIVATSDSNGHCGLSDAGSVRRLKKVGNDIYFFFKEDGQNVELKLIKQ